MEMSTNKDLWIIIFGVVGAVAGLIVGITVLWYMIKYSVASSIYMDTRDITAWRKSVRPAATKAAVATGITMFIAIESCVALVFLELLDFTLPRLMPWIAFGVLASLLAGGYILFHARWRDLMMKLIDWYRGQRKGESDKEATNR